MERRKEMLEKQLANLRIMKRRKEMVKKQLGSVAVDEVEAQSVVLEWARATNRSLTASELKALASVLSTNPELRLENLDYFLLGWNSRGDHNVMDIKNIMDAHKKLLNTVLLSQIQFQTSSKEVLTGFNNAVVKIYETAEKIAATKVIAQPAAHISSPSSHTTSLPGLASVRPLAPTVIENKEKNYKNFLRLIGRQEADFHSFFPHNSTPKVLEEFVGTFTNDVWATLLMGNGKDMVLDKLVKHIVGMRKQLRAA